MKCILVMFDSLNRRMLPSYGGDWVHAPNFARLAKRTVQFQNAYVCSMPCMPARREMHTGRPNFLHRSWGPLEPFDDSMPEILKNAGIYSHLVTDHYHYFEDGGATYHNRFSTWEFFRGQEGDMWHGQVARAPLTGAIAERKNSYGEQDRINRILLKSEADFPQAQTFAAGLDFIRRNQDQDQDQDQDQWFLQLETFDPHEPFVSDPKYKDLYAKHYDAYKAAGGKEFDWPPYRGVEETPEQVEHCRHEYAALMSMCDSYLGKVLTLMDELKMWDDTMLIVCTDHGLMLGEHDCWAKGWQPWYNENANIPLFIWDPRSKKKDETRNALVQTIDLAPTVLEFFGVARPKDMLGKPLAQTIANDTPVREAGIFGVHGAQVNVTDGRYVYMRAPATKENSPLFNYTLMPTQMRGFLGREQLLGTELADSFGFTKGYRPLKLPAAGAMFTGAHPDRAETLLFDLQKDPSQLHPITDPAVEARMVEHLSRLMREAEAPPEQYRRLGIPSAP